MDTFPATRPANELRLMYSMTIVRMVNGLVEVGQKGKFAHSVLGLAGRLGLPRVLVDMRHTATHDALPSLPSLRTAAALALEWLDKNYWQAQEDSLTEASDTTRALLNRYADIKDYRNRAAASSTSNGPVHLPQDGKARTEEALECVQALIQNTSSNNAREVLVPMLVKNDLLVPQYLRRMKTEHTWHEQKRETRRRQRDEVSRVAHLWAPMLEACMRQWGHFLGTLLANIVDQIVQLSQSPKQTPKTEARIELWLLWVENLLYARNFQNLIGELAIQVPVVALMQSASKHVSPWTNKINTLLLSWIANPALKSKMARVVHLTSVKNKRQAKEGDVGLEVFENLLSLIQQRGITAPTPAQSGGAWQRCEGWTPCSVGLSLVNDFPDLLLPQELDYNGAISLVPAERPVDPLTVLPFSAAAARLRIEAAAKDAVEDNELDNVPLPVGKKAATAQRRRKAAQEKEDALSPPAPSPAPPPAALLFSPMELIRL